MIFREHKVLYTLEGDVPEEAYTIPFGEANIVREGDDVTVVALGRMVHARRAGGRASSPADGIECEIIDPRTTSPLDEDTILESVENTGRLVVVDEANPRCGMAADIVALVAQRGASATLQGGAADGHAAAHARCRSRPVLEDAYVPDAGRRSPTAVRDDGRRAAAPA